MEARIHRSISEMSIESEPASPTRASSSHSTSFIAKGQRTPNDTPIARVKREQSVEVDHNAEDEELQVYALKLVASPPFESSNTRFKFLCTVLS